MRGIEAALQVYGEVNEGVFAAEALRKLYTNIAPSDRVLAATLIYCSLRREGLWKHLLMKYCRRNTKDMSELTYNALIIGIAGIVELKYFALPVLVNALVQSIKSRGEDRDIGLVNAVLHTVADEVGPYLKELKKSSALRDQALYWGIPGWAASQWSKDMSISEAKQLVRLSGMRTYLSLRLSRGVDGEEWLQEYRATGKKAWASPFLERSVRTPANPFPPEIPGFSEGRITPQSESSMFVSKAFSRRWKGVPLLDMCCGRGIKTGQLADMFPEAEIEAWDISEGRIKSAEYEMIRMGTRDRVSFYCGDSLKLEPKMDPKAIFVDAPCTGSGTWGRHPDSKWRITPEMVLDAADLQKKLLGRAVSLVAPGGVVGYSTCSMFREENEKVVAAVMAQHPEIIEVPVERNHKLMSKGKPYGTVIWPGLPWIDGFYLALLVKRK